MAHKQHGFYVVMRSDDPVFLQELFGGQLLMAPMFGSSAVARPLTPPTRTVDGVSACVSSNIRPNEFHYTNVANKIYNSVSGG
ncbi:hypothetical protein OUZ56_000139 [Daphnia magna]|uniref:Uncharacterized protein n=1 Tax=Daphnia magna TaxID=35525 RepID=A0ABQ9ZZH7_9CRUS|nr:hypothetical protein OUZ56_000139 [Daphnia magna]